MSNRVAILSATLVALSVGLIAMLLGREEPEPPMPLSIRLPSVQLPTVNMEYLKEAEATYKRAETVFKGYQEIRDAMDTVMIPTVDVELTSLGTYYITGYTSWELGGSVATASGATCHKASSYEDSFYNPTTCAIDPALHDFGEVFYIEKFGYYVAEDTGSAVKQKHIDLYYGLTYEENQEALTITGYYEVFSVEYVYGEVQATKYDIQGQVADLVIGWKLSDEMKGVTE